MGDASMSVKNTQGSEDAPRSNGQEVEYSDGDAVFEGYVVMPETDANIHACILLMHDWSGLTDPIRRLAERYAALGYICFALDVYGKGVRGDPAGDNSELMEPLMNNRALLRQRLIAGYKAAALFPGVDQERIAVVGYCFGGLCALDLVRACSPDIKAAVSFHGGLKPPDLGPCEEIDASILLLHGWADPIVPPEDVIAISKELTMAGADWQLHVYGHAQHAFTFEGANVPEHGIAYDRNADERSWDAMKYHLAKALCASAI